MMGTTERENRYAEAIGLANNRETRMEAARAVMAVADAEQAELRAEVERLRSAGVEWMRRHQEVLELGRDIKARLDAFVADLRGLHNEWSTAATAFWAGSSADAAPAAVLTKVVAKVAAVLDKHAGER